MFNNRYLAAKLQFKNIFMQCFIDIMKRKRICIKAVSLCIYLAEKLLKIYSYNVCKYISVCLIKQLFAAKTTVVTLIFFVHIV